MSEASVSEVIRDDNDDDDDDLEPQFAVERADLLEPLSLQDIEQRERISDPLHAVPDLPFGHLNAAWAAFLMKSGSGGYLWAFTAIRKADWGSVETLSGYAAVRGDSIGPWMFTEFRFMPDG